MGACRRPVLQPQTAHAAKVILVVRDRGEVRSHILTFLSSFRILATLPASCRLLKAPQYSSMRVMALVPTKSSVWRARFRLTSG